MPTQMQQLLKLGAACNVLYLFSMDVDTLTGRFRVIDGGTLQVGTATIGRDWGASFLVP